MFSNWTFLSKHGEDPYINMLARSVGQQAVSDMDYQASHGPIVLRGIMKHKLIKQCWQDQRPFVFVDTGYWGNEASARNPQANKIWHRIVINDIQHNDLLSRSSHRWQQWHRDIPQRRRGSTVIVAAPDDKPCKFYGIDRQQWLDSTLEQLRQHCDFPIVVRHRVKNRNQRILLEPLRALLEDCHVLVTFNSTAAIEAIMMGVPAIVTSPSHAASPVASRDISTVADPWYPDTDLLYRWLCHLSYGQWHVNEMRDGSALHQIREDLCQKNLL